MNGWTCFKELFLFHQVAQYIQFRRIKELTQTGLSVNLKNSESLLNHVYSTLCRRLVQVNETRAILLILRCMKLLLEKEVS